MHRALLLALLLGTATVIEACRSDTGTGTNPPAALLSISGDGQIGRVGETLPLPVVVQVVDATGTAVAGVMVTWTVSAGGGAVTSPSTTSDAGGLARATWILGTLAGANTLTAAASGTPTVNFTATAEPGLPSRLNFDVQPTPAVVGVAFVPAIAVTALDAFGNVATGFNGNVTLAIGANPSSATLTGTVTQGAMSGVATFADLSIERAGVGYTLVATAPALAPDTSASFTMAPAAASALVFSPAPSTSVIAGEPVLVVVAVRDSFGNTAIDFTGNVNLTLGANPGGASSFSVTVSAAAGVAPFAIQLDKVGTGYTLVATSGLLTAESAPFNVLPGTAQQLIFTVEPSTAVAGVTLAPAVEVTALDGGGNVATGFSGSVTLAIGLNPGGALLSGTTTGAALNGIATFADLSLDKAGIGYTLVASSAALSTATSSPFDITPPNFALDFSTDWVTVPDHTDLDLNTTWTIEAWIKPRSLGFGQEIVSKWGGGGDASYVLEISTTGGLRSAIHDGVNASQAVESNGSLTANIWQHVAITLENGTLRLYINGALDRTFSNSQTPMNSTRPLSFGREGEPCACAFYDGLIDEVRLWNVARTQPQLAGAMGTRLQGNEVGLVGYWRFDAGNGDTASDATGRGHDGRLGNAVGVDGNDPQWTLDAAPVF